MEVSGYSMALYCDHESRWHKYNEFPHQYHGRTRGKCAVEARRHGWIFHTNGTMTCPKCNMKKRQEDNDA